MIIAGALAPEHLVSENQDAAMPCFASRLDLGQYPPRRDREMESSGPAGFYTLATDGGQIGQKERKNDQDSDNTAETSDLSDLSGAARCADVGLLTAKISHQGEEALFLHCFINKPPFHRGIKTYD